ncbi:14-3-3-like protein GF14 kappa isoform X1 [Phoenix dactylifera]|uniref:14-3-3-like protein GF14 kappa isoform X1 n=1 Tax=Phoenix dactylifera TaxID=42345 RepID=A0A8B8JCQ2_PHODC|nr:14-3-3-like protein GF14 kappa isoform X1 [Phoenix dactylifera]
MEFDETLNREQYVFFAKLAEQAERYDDMAGFMKKIMQRTPSFRGFTVEERGMFVVAYKNVVGARRTAWRIVSSIEQKEERRRNEANSAVLKDYRGQIEADLASICGEVLGLLDSQLIPSAGSSESKVFYLKMKGDYHRYLAEFKVGEERRQAAKDAAAAYNAAQDIANVALAPTHPFRLGLDLNFSVFFHDIMKSTETACRMAKQAFEGAFADLDNLGEDFYRDATLIMRLLRDNLTLWTSEVQEQTDEA